MVRIYAFSVVFSILVSFIFISLSSATVSNRVALVIGNSKYQDFPLKTPANDAQDVSADLAGIGFEVMTLTNADRREMLEGLNVFAENLKNVKIGLFFYAGHAMQMDGANYLIPTKANVQSAADIKYETVRVSRVIDKMSEASTRLSVIILDACQDNPFQGFFPNPTQGLASVESPADTIIAYAALPGSVAHDGTGRNSIFTKHLLQVLGDGDLNVGEWLDGAGKGVIQETNRQQIPWTQSSQIDPINMAGDKPAKIKSSAEPTPIEEQVEPIKETEGGATQWGWLEVNAWPSDASIRILNIGPKYKPGMKLPTGRYHIDVSKQGYKTLRQWIDLASEEHATYDFELEEEHPGSGSSTTHVSHSKITESDNISSTTIMDASDKQLLNETFEKGKSGLTVSWANANSGIDYQVIPQPAFTDRSTNRICRKAEILTNIGGGSQKTVIMACRNFRGQWVVSY